jgi:chromosome segregation ATPase
MMNRTWGAVGLVTLISLWACAGCARTTGASLESNEEFRQIKMSLKESQEQKAQLEQEAKRLNEALAKAEKAKGDLDGQVKGLTESRRDLEGKVDELGKARVSLDARVNDLTKSRDELQKTVESLTKTRDAAVAESREAQAKADTLNDKVKAQTKQIADLQEQLKMIRSTLGQLQQKLD